MTYLEAIILGIVQGVFMFVPVSSTAHLVLTQHWLIAQGSALPPPESPAMILFDLVVHVGTMVSVVVVFRQSLLYLVRSTLAQAWTLARGHPVIGPSLWLVLMGALTVFVTGVLGLIFKRSIEIAFAAPEIIVVTLTITGILLWLTDRLGPRTVGLKGIGPRIALIVGAAQALALVPGISRSGITIIAGLFAGLKRRWAAEFSFLVAIPTILAATALQSLEVMNAGGLDGVGPGPLLVGFLVSAVVGIYALKLVLALLYRARLKVFSFYIWTFAALIAFGVLDVAK
ncbi:MAG: undecaprenyl-diphosphate phosphatase [Geminicoccaceae bacterium]|nr:MAG: undecaprenyl-diphosphate phosphatase [Geminicoccaceae bacterium]